MPVLNIAPAWSYLSTLSAAPLRPWHTFLRTTEERLRPQRIADHRPVIIRAQANALSQEGAGVHSRARILREAGAGSVPTIVLGGFVPDSSEQIFLLRRFLLRSGDVYCMNYSREDFSLDLVCAQLTDLVDELQAAGTPPVMFAVSFGAGIVSEWLRRRRLAGFDPVLSGIVLVSPVTCVADVMAVDGVKPSTLLGRALRPYLGPGPVTTAALEKSRAIFVRMFEAGAQNQKALRMLMSREEIDRLRTAVLGAIRGITLEGACARVAALQTMLAPTSYFTPGLLPLTRVPTLILFAEQEDAVLDPASPTRFAFDHGCRAFFSSGRVQWVTSKASDSPVQHASLIFHVFDFLPPLQHFYRCARGRALPLAA